MVVLDGERREVDIDPGRSTLRVGAHEWPYRVVSSTGTSITFEVLGERIEVRGDSVEPGMPDGPLEVNGEMHSVRVESVAGSAPGPPVGNRAPGASAAGSAAKDVASDGAGRPIFPPMPGKVLEVRVREGDRVKAGQVLVVIEAMKMRNEVAAPTAGEVAGLRVSPGANVGAREVLLRVVPV